MNPANLTPGRGGKQMRPSFLILLAVTLVWAWGVAAKKHEQKVLDDNARLRAQNSILARQMYAFDSVDPLTGKQKIVEVIEHAIAIEGVDWDDKQVEAMARLCWRESRYNPLLQNPRSTAFGLWQFLDSTWKYYGIEKTSDPLLQTIAAVRYIEDRYKTPKKALEFHLVAREVNGVVQHYY
jgi:hypothetical protein